MLCSIKLSVVSHSHIFLGFNIDLQNNKGCAGDSSSGAAKLQGKMAGDAEVQAWWLVAFPREAQRSTG